jgi:DNA-binding transcriptional ArsR family regulator
MSDGPNIARIAALIGDPARSEVLATLIADRALTATELSTIAGVTKQTMSAHLGKLLDARLIAVEKQGRHRYYRLANRDVAELLESLMGVAYRTGSVRLKSGPREPALRRARVCYDHLAGELAVAAFEALVAKKVLRTDFGSVGPGNAASQWFGNFGIDLEALAAERRVLCRACLDWGERRHHLAGALGGAILARVFELKWARREGQTRVVRFTASGESEFKRAFGLEERLS